MSCGAGVGPPDRTPHGRRPDRTMPRPKRLRRLALAVLGVVLLAVAVGAVILWKYLHDLRPQGVHDGSVAIAAPVRRGRAPLQVPSEVPSPSVAATVVRIVVRNGKGEPVEGATVEITPCGGGPVGRMVLSAVATASTSGVTTADGTASFRRNERVALQVWVHARDYASASARCYGDELDVVLVPAIELRGVVFDHTTQLGVPGAVVQLQSTLPVLGSRADAPPTPAIQARTREDGTFAMDDARAGRQWIEVSAPGYAPTGPVAVDLRDDSQTPLRLGLARALTVSGFVRDAESRAPLAAGTIVVGFGAGNESEAVPIAPDGHFAATGLTSTSVTFRVVSDGWDPAAGHNVGTQPQWDSRSGALVREAEILVRRSRIVRGRTLTTSGDPIPGVVILAGGPTLLAATADVALGLPGSNRVATARSSTDGGYVVTLPVNLANVPLTLVALHPDFAPLMRRMEVQTTAVGTVDLNLDTGAELLVDVASIPPGDACRVSLTLLDELHPGLPGLALTDGLWPELVTSDGRATFPHCGPGRWIVKAVCLSSDLGTSKSIDIREGGPCHVDLELSAEATIVGEVVDPQGMPVADATIMLPQSPAPHRMTQSDHSGRFGFKHVPSAGDLSIRVISGFAVVEQPVTRDLRMRVVVPQDDSREIRLRIVDATSGQPVPWGTLVAHVPLPGGDGTQDVRSSFSGGVAVARIRQVPDCRIQVTAPGFDSATVEALEPPDEVRLLPPAVDLGILEVRIPEKFSPILEAVAYDQSSGAAVARADVVAPTLARFRFERSADVAIDVVVRGGYLSAPKCLHVSASERMELSVEFAEGGGQVRGTGAATAPDAQVVLVGPSGLSRKLPTSKDGRFATGPIAPGTYELRCAGRRPVTVSVASGEIRTVELQE